jgi:hypothetical protein
MFLRAFITMIAVDAIDRRTREQQYRAWVAAEEARAAVAGATHRPRFAPVEFDPRRPVRPA